MVRVVLGVALLWTVGAGSSMTAAPPARVETVRFLSRAEAFSSILKRFGAKSASLQQQRERDQALANVEVAYWALAAACWQLHSRELGLRMVEATRREVGANPSIQGQRDLLKAQRLQAISTVQEKERKLREALGLPESSGPRLRPSDAPHLTESKPDWNKALKEALSLRPELLMARWEVIAAQWVVFIAKIGDALPGSWGCRQGVLAILRGLPAMRAWVDRVKKELTPTRWSFFPPPISDAVNDPFGGFGRLAQLHLARAMETLKDQEMKVQRFLGRYYEQISVSYENVRDNRAQREAFGDELRARQEQLEAGRENLDVLLEAQRFWIDALADESQAVATYNTNLIAFQYHKGTILPHVQSIINPRKPEPDPLGFSEIDQDAIQRIDWIELQQR
jgi:hypothetical protein